MFQTAPFAGRKRNYSSSPPRRTPDPPPAEERTDDVVLYEAPFAAATLRLKRVSITTAAVSFVGLPSLLLLQYGTIPAAGQLAVSGTAILAAVGSTVLLNWCITPYVHRLERIGGSAEIVATYVNIFGMRKTVSFDPRTDVIHVDPSGKKMFRPFVNFFVKPDMVPLYVHPSMIEDRLLKIQLVGKQEAFKKS